MSDAAVEQRAQRPLVVRLVGGLVRAVFVEPVRGGTLSLRHHSAGVAGITIAVVLIYAGVLVAVIAARPLREASDFAADTSRGDVTVIPELLAPGLLALIGLALALVLAGSQRGHPVLRAVVLLGVAAIIGTVILVVPATDGRSLTWWGAAAGLLATVVYCMTMWRWGSHPAIDFLVLLTLVLGTLALAYSAMVAGQASSELRFDIVTLALLMTYLTLLASPVAFASGLSAVGVGIAAVAWSADFLRERARPVTVAVALALVSAWQCWILWSRLTEDSADWLRELVSALVVAGVGFGVWRRVRVERRAPTDVVADATRFGLPVGYILQSGVVVTALLSLVALGLSAAGRSWDPLTDLTSALASPAMATAVRWVTVGALVVAGLIAARRGRRVLAGIAWVNAIVLASVILTTPDSPLAAWGWTPDAMGDAGLLVAVLLAVAWLLRRTWTSDRAGLLLLIVALSALAREANVLETPMGFLLGASATGLLVFGMAWSMLTGGADHHVAGRWLPADRRLLLFLGESMYAMAIVAWAIIGKEGGSASSLSAFAALAVLTLGTSLVLASVYAQANPRSRPPGPTPAEVHQMVV